MLVDATTGTFLTQREFPRMALIAPSITDDAAAGGRHRGGVAPTVPSIKEGPRRPVKVWRDTCPAVDEGDEFAAWLSDFLHTSCRVVRLAPDFVRTVDPGLRDRSRRSRRLRGRLPAAAARAGIAR